MTFLRKYRRQLALVAIGVAMIVVVALILPPPQPAPTHPARRELARSLVTEAGLLVRNGQLREAADKLAVARLSDPTWPEPYLRRAQVLKACVNMRGAREELLLAHQHFPDDPTVTIELLRLSITFVPPEETERLARLAIQQEQFKAEALCYLGMAIGRAENSTRFSEALAALRESRRLAPTSALALIELGRMLQRMGDPKEAARVLGEALNGLDRIPQDQQVEAGPLSHWLDQRRAVAFLLSSVYRDLGRTQDMQEAARESALLSHAASELRRLRDRATVQPPDADARRQLDAILEQGAGFWKSAGTRRASRASGPPRDHRTPPRTMSAS